MNEQPILQLWLEPCRFRRHYLAHVGDRKKVVHRRRKHRKRDLCFAFVDHADELLSAPGTADESNAGIGPRVADAEHRREKIVLQDADIEAFDGVKILILGRIEPQPEPLSLKVHTHFAALARIIFE